MGCRRRRPAAGRPPGDRQPSAARWPTGCRRRVGSTRRSASATRCVAGADGTLAALLALEGLADAALYQGRLEQARALSTRAAGAGGAELGDCYYADMGTVGLALAIAYGGDADGALALVDGGPSCSSPSCGGVVRVHPRRGDPRPRRAERRSSTSTTRWPRLGGRRDRYLTEVALVSSSSLRARTGELAGAVARFTELLDNFRHGGDESHLVTSLRNLVTLLVRLRQYRPAAALYGAVRDHPSSPTYGAEAARLEAAAAESGDALGDEEFARVVERRAPAIPRCRRRRRRRGVGPRRRPPRPPGAAPSARVASTAMAAVGVNGLTIEYDVQGDPGAPPLLLVMGLGGQLIGWSQDFVDRLLAAGSGSSASTTVTPACRRRSTPRSRPAGSWRRR